MNANSPFNSAQGAIDAATTPEEACDFLTTFWIAQGVCFTSGHVVDAIRQARTDLVFSQSRIGGHLRASFSEGSLPGYDDGMGGSLPVCRQMRLTTSTGTRTPVGTEVFVYGPSDDECNCFEFEINIAAGSPVSDGLGGQVSAAAAMLGATPNLPQGSPGASTIPPVQPSGTVAVANGKMVPGTPMASIHSDGRLCVPRIAFEALAFESGTPIKGGEPLYAEVVGTKLVISQSQWKTGMGNPLEVYPTTDRLRLHLSTPTPFPVGKEFEIKVSSTGLTLDLV